MDKLIGIHIVPPGVEFLTPKHIPNWASAFTGIIEECGRTSYKSEGKMGEGTGPKFIKKHLIHESIIEHSAFTVRFTCSRSCSHQLVRHRLAAYTQESQRFCDYSSSRFEEDVVQSKWDEDAEVETEKVKVLKVILPPVFAGGNTLMNGHIITRGSPSFGINDGSLALNGGDGPDVPLQAWLAHNAEAEGLSNAHLEVIGKWCDKRIDDYIEYLEWRSLKIPSEDARSCLPNAAKTEVATTMNFRMWRHVLGHPVFGRTLNKHAQWEIKGITLPVLELLEEELPYMFGDLRNG